MLEILLIIQFTRRVAAEATSRGHSAPKYVAAAIVFWIVGEITGGFIGGMLDLGLGSYALALMGAGAGAFAAWKLVTSLPEREAESRLDPTVFE